MQNRLEGGWWHRACDFHFTTCRRHKLSSAQTCHGGCQNIYVLGCDVKFNIHNISIMSIAFIGQNIPTLDRTSQHACTTCQCSCTTCKHNISCKHNMSYISVYLQYASMHQSSWISHKGISLHYSLLEKTL